MELTGFKSQQLQKAVSSLLKYVGDADKSTQLLEEDEVFHLVVSLKKAPVGPRKDKPIRIAVPHPLWTAEGAEVCLFVKDHKGEGHKAAKQRLAKLLKNGGVAKVVGLSKLRAKYESHEAKRQLCSSYDLFLADERIIPSLPKLIGKSFFKRKKQPIPVDMRAADFPKQVQAALAATYMTPPQGTCVSVRVARSSMEQQQIVENAMAALRGVVRNVPKKWSNVQAVYIKSSESVSLPVYQVLPEEPIKIGQQQQAQEEDSQ
jgi:ribosome biogenesis protein UTP30